MECSWTKLLVTILLALLGWLVVHYLSSNRDRNNKKRDLRTNYLIEAYRNIEKACGYDDYLPASLNRVIESAIADVQLFGTKYQIDLARQFTDEMNKNSYSDPRKLLVQLRSELRSELNLEQISMDPSIIFHWRLKDKNES